MYPEVLDRVLGSAWVDAWVPDRDVTLDESPLSQFLFSFVALGQILLQKRSHEMFTVLGQVFACGGIHQSP